MTTLPRHSKSPRAKEKRSAEREMKHLVRQRAEVFNFGRCESCGNDQGTEVAHRLARGRMGDHLASNALLACHMCHEGQRDGKGGEVLATALGQVLPGQINGRKPDSAAIPVQCVYGRVYLDDFGGYREAL